MKRKDGGVTHDANGKRLPAADSKPSEPIKPGTLRQVAAPPPGTIRLESLVEDCLEDLDKDSGVQ